jgi:hypothetical protein
MNATLTICVDERALSETARRFFYGIPAATNSQSRNGRCAVRTSNRPRISRGDRLEQVRRRLIRETELYLSNPHSVGWARAG